MRSVQIAFFCVARITGGGVFFLVVVEVEKNASFAVVVFAPLSKRRAKTEDER
jgi:hypothetical protein